MKYIPAYINFMAEIHEPKTKGDFRGLENGRIKNFTEGQANRQAPVEIHSKF